MPEIILTNVTKRWGDFVAVDNLNLTIENGSFVTLLGSSGCGKTTTLRMIAGLETPTEGKITLDGETVFDSERGVNVPPQKRNIGFLFQNYALWPHMTVYKNIAFGLENLKWKKPDIAARVDEMCKMLKIEQFKDRYPSELSGGQQQRVAIARTLAPKPTLLLMDEPLSNLDAKLRLEMRTELKRLHLETKSTFVYVTHDQLEAMTLANKICLMDAGVMQQYDPPLTTYNLPANLFSANFVGNPPMNFIDATARKCGAKKYELEFSGMKATLTTKEPVDGGDETKEVVLGVRPEFISICDSDKGIPSSIYSTLPSGMETTIKLKHEDMILSAVAFGSVDYPVNTHVHFEIKGSNILLFDKESTNRIAVGKLEIV